MNTDQPDPPTDDAAPSDAADAADATTAAADPPGWLPKVVLFLSGQTVSLFGSMLVQYAVFWYLTITYQSGVIMTLAAIFGFLPQAVVSVFGGVWADRHNRKYLIIGADAAIAASTLVLALLMIGGFDAPWLIFAVLAVRSAGAGIQTPAVAALIPQITPTRHLMRINGINGSIQSAMALLAPAVAGAIYAWSSAVNDGSSAALVPIFFIDVVTAVIGIGLLSFVSVSAVRRAQDAQTGYFADLVDGVRYIAHHEFVRWLLVLFAIIFVLTVAPSNLTPLMLVRSFPAGEAQDVVNLAVLEIAFSVGMMLGGILIATFFAARSRVGLIIVASLVFGVLSIGLGLSPNVWVFFAIMFLVGLAVPFFSTPSMTLLQETVEPERQGRVFGFVGIVMAVAMPLGMVVFGPLADVMPIELLLVAAGILTFVVVGLAVWLPSGRRAIAAARAASTVAKGDPVAGAAVVEQAMHRDAD
ncbi:DHA3 family macrolide efflux protein-like MFS transporter [Microbacterium terrae]|uniref:Enterobactin exporter EntS n=1 Tax=Microbacterium terrae TaxID=69369 RepID=A0A0M2HAL6_9MICO|nr:MFS transporter [Microbacterium terrae]KJL41704.1 enterobactin exporter EntS [Microbacterium terrae]MBP1078005.1 DHA3 family macrolide efflux protein-like MFS transporter [Microbacterium terrae]GLK00174.1 MFS transporter [Microbacterium terrae]